MQMLAVVLLIIGIAAGMGAVATGFYIVIYGWKNANPRDHRNPDWLVVLWRRYKLQIVGYFCCVAVCFTALLLAAAIERHAS